MPQKDIYSGYRCVIVTMTEESGLELNMICESAVIAETFNKFLESLSQRFRRRPLALFMDQLSVHRAIAVKPTYQKLDILPVYNVSYSPQFNPIEAVFSKLKAHFSRQRLHNLVNKLGFNADRQIKTALTKITQRHCAACARKSFHLL